MNNKIYKKLFVGFGFVSIVLILTLFIMSQTYIQNLVYHERLNQMEEVTHQMFHSLEDVIDNHWDEVDVQCNYLYNTPLETDTDLYRYLKKLSELSNYHEKQIELIAVDAAGRYYTEYGRTGLLREMNYLENAPQRVSYVSNSLTVDDSRMVFLEQLSTPITLQSGEKEITLRYFGISQCMTQLNDYFRCDAYENNNSVYVLDNNGFKLFNANDTELLKGHNVYTVLSQMSYLHGSSFAEAKERLTRTGSCYSNAVLDGTEYFYALKQMENAQWTLAFLVPAEYVAVNTQKLVNIVMAVIVGFATVFSIMAVIAGLFLLREKQQRELRAEKETNLRLEQYNIQLTQANDEMRRAQDAAAEALQSAERASKAKTDFLSNMSHDIRTPMNAIIGYADLAEKHRQEPERLQGYLKNIQVSGEKMLSIIDNVLELSRIESGKVTLEETAVEAGSIFESCVVMVQPELERKHQTMTVEKHTPNPYLYMDTSRILEVTLNLVSNAIKYTGDGGHIRCAIRQLPSDREGWCVQELSVADNGIGMSEEFQQHIFEAFARERSSTVSGVEGSGLGMGIVKKLVDLMDGSIDIQSKLGEGSTFTVHIPCRLARQEDAVPKCAAGRVDKTGLAGRRILLAEDNDLNAEIATELMGEEGLLVDRAENGARCLEMLEKAPAGMYDAILMDVQMPVLDGYEATRKIRRLEDPWRANIPIIAITANAFAEDRQRALEVGMDDHVAKPIDMAKLIPVLQKQLHKHDGEAEEKRFSQSAP